MSDQRGETSSPRAPPARRARPGSGWDDLRWEAGGEDLAVVTVREGDARQSAEGHIGADGRPVRVVFQRWSDQNPERVYRRQPFGGDLSAFEAFGGFRLPTRVIGGNDYGTDGYDAFFDAEVTHVRF